MAIKVEVYDETYRKALCKFCKEVALLAELEERARDGEDISKKEIKRAKGQSKISHARLIKIKKSLGYKDGVSFMQNCKFKGFELKNGRVEGNIFAIPDVALNWVEGINEDDAHRFKYEVGTYLMCYYMAYCGLFDEVENPRAARELKTNLWNRVKEMLSLGFLNLERSVLS